MNVVRRLHARAVRGGRDSGAVAGFVVAIAVALLLVGGLVVDGGRAINARQQVTDDAEQAARAGANVTERDALRGGELRLDPDGAREAAVAYLAGLPGRSYTAGDVQVVTSGAGITVRTRDTVQSTLLGLVGVPTFTVSGEATSEPAAGVSGRF